METTKKSIANKMSKIIITKQEVEACKQKARELSQGYDCYYYYLQRDKQFDRLLQEKTNMKNISFDLNGGDLMYGERANPRIKTRKLVVKEEGFSAKEYTSLTRERLPNIDYDILIRLDEETGKVHAYEPNGNISIQRGAPSFSTEYKHLIKEVYTECNDIVVEIL